MSMYLDYASATPVSDLALEAMRPFFQDQFFNPSAPYLPAKKVRSVYEDAKAIIAHSIGAKGDDLIVTSGATEANNLAFSAVDYIITEQKTKPEVLVLETEHASVLNLAKKYPYQVVKVDKNGLIDLNDFSKKLTKKTAFVSVALANNELGSIQPLSEIARIIAKEKQRRLEDGKELPLIFHSDASQALNLINLSVSRLGVDLLTINSAKVYGPKGVGALFVGHQVRLNPITFGGGQEKGLRSGTENVPAVVGFATAAEEARNHSNSARKNYEKLIIKLKEELRKAKIEPIFLGSTKHQLANFCPVSFPGIDAERIIFKLEDKEVYLSTGAACSANKGLKSHVLQAIGLSDEEIDGSLRISLGKDNTEEDIKRAGQLIVEAVDQEAERIGLV